MGVTQVESSSTPLGEDATVHIHAKTYIVIASINFAYMAQLIAIVGSGLLAQSVGQLFHATTDAFWLSTVITIITVVLAPPVSQVADLWGRKWLIVFGMTCGFIGSLVASRAESMGTAIAGFAIIGICFGCQPQLHAVVSEVLPRKQRPIAQASVNVAAGSGAVIGIFMGGALLRGGDLEKYRIFMYVLAALFGSATLGVVLCYNPPPRKLQKSLSSSAKLRSLDWIGVAIFTPGLVLFCVALSWSRNPYPWSEARILAPFILGVVLMAAFFTYEWRFKKDGILHHGLFKNRNFSLALLAVFAEGLTFFAANAYYVFEVSFFTQSDFLVSAAHFAVTFLTAVAFALFAGIYSTKTKSIRTPIISGFVLILVFNICMATSTPTTKTAFWGFATILGAGLGVILPTIMVMAQLNTPGELISTASALVIAVRSLGATIGLAINNALFNDALKTEIPKRIAAATLPLGLPRSSLPMLIGALVKRDKKAAAKVPGVTPRIIGAAVAALKQAYGVGFRHAWIAAACFCCIAIVSGLFFLDPRSQFTTHIDAPAEQKLVEEQERLEGHIKEHGHVNEIEEA